jgi:alpha-galactosidase
MPNLTPLTAPEDMAKSRFWTAAFFADPGSLPVSFSYNGKVISGIPANWKPTVRKNRIDANMMQTVYEGKDSVTGLAIKVESLDYFDFPVVEWTAWLTQTGEQPTPMINDFLALDGGFEGSSPVVVHCNGDYYNEDGYKPEDSPLKDGEKLVFAPAGGRPCDQAFPYYRILFDGGGLSMAVGWPAQWSASFERKGKLVQIKAGQEKTHLKLLPGETIRSPRMTLMSWTGEVDRGVNLWRRWYLAHVLPRPDGKPMRPLMALATTDVGEEFTAATEENQVRYMDRFKGFGFDFDVWWIDAGWYPCYNEKMERRWWLTGHWVPDPERFPHGFKPISDNAAKYGARLLVWFKPERVTAGSWLETHHPEWLLKTDDQQNRLLNLGIPECRAWLTEHVNQVIQENGIGVYRQDFNFEPLKFWRENEPEDRQGINENLHVQGYLQYWDELLRRNPGLWIDSCSSGGRRNDMETMRRSVPLHYTDYGYGTHPVKLAFHHTLYQWIPYFKDFTLSADLQNLDQYNYPSGDKAVDSFSFHCGMAPMLFPIINIRSSHYDHTPEVAMSRVWRRAAELFLYGDYYPLTPFSKSPERWVAWQFENPESGEGLFQAIRLAECPEDIYVAHLKGMETGREYIFENGETGEKRTLMGATLEKEGFAIELPKRGGVIWFYRSTMREKSNR